MAWTRAIKIFLTHAASNRDRKSVFCYFFIVCGPALLASLFRWALDPLLGDQGPFILYLPAIIVATAYGGWKAGVAATLLSNLCVIYLWMPPRGSFTLSSPAAVIGMLLFLGVPLFVVYTIEALQRTTLLQEKTAAALEQSQRELRRHATGLERLVSERTAKLQETVTELESFSYTISHDLRSPLRAMQGFSHLLMQEHADQLDAEAREYLIRIETAARRMDALLKDLVTYNRISRGDLSGEPVDPETLLREVLEHYPEIKQPHAAFDVQRPLHKVDANPSALLQVLSNLLTNAVKFVGAGQNASIRIWTEAHGHFVRLFVQDNGIGIAHELIPKVFEPFQRAHPRAGYEGTGMGLAIVKKAVERMGGAIGVDSEVGKGSRFWIDLPAAR